MQEKVFAYLRQWNMVKPGDTVLVGFSGGADSTALLQLLWNYGKRIPLQLEAVHVNHGIRGAEALRDQQFCEQFCQERNISFTVVQEDVPAQAARDGLSLEEAGRNARRRVFEHLAEKCQASVIALAHHQRDQAETMLFRLMRGTGLRGLCGMRPVNGNYIRPLLCVDRPQIEQYLLEEGIRWVEDGTNQELDYTRNQIRHGLLAPMERVMPGCVARMAGTAARLSEVESYLEQESEFGWRHLTSCIRPCRRCWCGVHWNICPEAFGMWRHFMWSRSACWHMENGGAGYCCHRRTQQCWNMTVLY